MTVLDPHTFENADFIYKRSAGTWDIPSEWGLPPEEMNHGAACRRIVPALEVVIAVVTSLLPPGSENI
eukprot:3492454-Pleurochrysis_carterae.AAC.1